MNDQVLKALVYLLVFTLAGVLFGVGQVVGTFIGAALVDRYKRGKR